MENPLYTNTQKLATFPSPIPALLRHKMILWQRILNPQRRFGLWCFFKASLPCPVPWVERGVYKNGGLGKPPWYRAAGPSDVNVRHPPSETFTGNLNLTLINKTKRLFTQRIPTLDLSHMKDKVLYIYTQQGVAGL